MAFDLAIILLKTICITTILNILIALTVVYTNFYRIKPNLFQPYQYYHNLSPIYLSYQIYNRTLKQNTLLVLTFFLRAPCMTLMNLIKNNIFGSKIHKNKVIKNLNRYVTRIAIVQLAHCATSALPNVLSTLN